MSVAFGSPLTSANTNDAFVSRTQDTDMVGQLDNQNTTEATNQTTGAIHTEGGISAAKNIHGEALYSHEHDGDKVLVSGADKKVTETIVSTDEVEYLSGVTAPIQAQIDAKADDSSVVHKTGAESIAGVKTFTDDTNLDGDVVIGGNLTVSGTTTTLNTATLDVADQNVTVNDGGNDATAEGAGLTVERTGVDGSFVYQDSLVSKWKAGAIGSESEVIVAAGSQTMTGEKTAAKLIISGELKLTETIDTTTTGTGATLSLLTPTVRLKNASLVSLNNLDDVAFGKCAIITNATGTAITLINDAGGTAIKRILTGTGFDLSLANGASVIVSYNSDASRWQVVGGSGSGGGNAFQEVPTGTVDGVNDTFTLSETPASADALVVFVDGVAAMQSEYALVGDDIIFVSGSIPALGQSVYAFYTGAPGGGGGGSLTPVTQYVTLNGTDITNKYVTLSGAPTSPTSVLLDLIGGGAQEYSVDFTVSGSQLSWNGLALDGFLASSDKLRIHYFT